MHGIKLNHVKLLFFVGQILAISSVSLVFLFAFSTTMWEIHLLYKLICDLPLGFLIHFNEKILIFNGIDLF